MITPWPIVVLAVVLGLAVGSFLNVVIYRVPQGLSVVRPASACPRCETEIRNRHNVPVVGWLVLRGRCAACALPISARYPLVEAATGLLFGGLTLRFGVTAALPALLFLAAIAVALAMIDFDVRRLPQSLVLPSCAVALALLALAAAVDGTWLPLARSVVGGGAVALTAFALYRAYPDRVVSTALAGLLGGYLAWLSWTALAVGVVLAAAVTLVARRPAGARLGVPIGACLIAATVLIVFAAGPGAAWSTSLPTV